MTSANFNIEDKIDECADKVADDILCGNLEPKDRAPAFKSLVQYWAIKNKINPDGKEGGKLQDYEKSILGNGAN